MAGSWEVRDHPIPSTLFSAPVATRTTSRSGNEGGRGLVWDRVVAASHGPVLNRLLASILVVSLTNTVALA